MHKSNRLFHGTIGAIPNQIAKWLCPAVAIALLTTALCLPLWAKSPDKGNVMDDVRDGIRDFGREVSDMVDPDQNGILPDGSIDNGIANDGNQNTPSTTVPDSTDKPSDTTAVTTDRVPETTVSTTRPATTTRPADTTRPNGAPDGDVSGNAPDGDTTNDAQDTADEGGFPWVGIVIALIIVAAVVLLIIMLLPKRDKTDNS